jgi:hypothetical protein
MLNQPVEVGDLLALPHGQLERMVAKAGNPPVQHPRSRAGRGISQALRVERLFWLGGGFTEESFQFRARAGIGQQLLPSFVVLPGEKERGDVGDFALLL